jgi:hypothetical protein
MPQLLICGEQTKRAEKPPQVAGFISEWRPASNRNGGRDQIGIPGRIESEFALMNSPLLAGGAREEAAPTGRGNDREERERLAQLAKRELFDRLYARWLECRASLASSDDVASDDVMDAKQDALDEAAREFLVMPAFLDWMIWKKWEVLEFDLNEDVLAGKHADNRTVVALASIKADLMSLGIGNGGDQ